MPAATLNPWPSDPVATSTKLSRGVGWPSRSLSILRRFSCSSTGKRPARDQAAYKMGAACPLDRMKRSDEAPRGSDNLYFMTRKKRHDMISAIEAQDVGCLQSRSRIVKKNSIYLVTLSVLYIPRLVGISGPDGVDPEPVSQDTEVTNGLVIQLGGHFSIALIDLRRRGER